MKLLLKPSVFPRGCLVVLLFCFLAVSVRSQEKQAKDTFDITRHSMRFPHEYKKWGFQIAAGFSMVQPPRDLLENAIQAPLVNIHMTFGLPWRLSLEGDLTTIVVSNQLAIGPRIGYGVRNFYFNAGFDAAFVYGQLRQAGFDNTTKVWIYYPNLSVGYKLKRMAFTLKYEMVLVGKATMSSGPNEVVTAKNFYNGGTFAFYLEQRLWKDHVFVFGLKDNYVKYYWPTWMLYTTFNRFYNIPELYFSWIL
jgi:hypothetical protein